MTILWTDKYYQHKVTSLTSSEAITSITSLTSKKNEVTSLTSSEAITSLTSKKNEVTSITSSEAITSLTSKKNEVTSLTSRITGFFSHFGRKPLFLQKTIRKYAKTALFHTAYIAPHRYGTIRHAHHGICGLHGRHRNR